MLQTGVPDASSARVYGTFTMTNGLISLASVGLAGVGGRILGIVPMLRGAGSLTLAAGLLALVTLPKAGPQRTTHDVQLPHVPDA